MDSRHTQGGSARKGTVKQMGLTWKNALHALGMAFGSARMPALKVPPTDTLTGAQIMGGLANTPMFQAYPLEVQSEFRKHFVAMVNERAQKHRPSEFSSVEYTFEIANSLAYALEKTTSRGTEVPEGAFPLIAALKETLPTIRESDVYASAMRFAAGLTLVRKSEEGAKPPSQS